MVRIRLRRVGSKGQPSYRVVITDKRSPRDGRFIEKIGFYNPRTEPATMELNEERALYWLSQGAQPSDAVQRILDKLGTTERYARLRAGESMEALVAEAEKEKETRGSVDPRTRRDDLPVQSKKKVEEPAEEEVVEAEAPVEEEVVEAEAPEETVEAEADETVEAEAEETSEETEEAEAE